MKINLGTILSWSRSVSAECTAMSIFVGGAIEQCAELWITDGRNSSDQQPSSYRKRCNVSVT